MKNKLLVSLAATLLSASAATAQTLSATEDTVAVLGNKIITNARMIGIGGVGILDTYLSQEKYAGTELRYISHTIRERDGRRWSRMIVHQGYVSTSHNRADNRNELGGMYNFAYGVHYNWRLMGGRLQVKAGAMADVQAGFLYNTGNTNNPAQARLSLDIAPTAIATYRLSAWNRPMALRYEVSAPLCGLMFSPNYGQSYYEIFSRGDYDHNIVPTTFVSTPSLRHMLSVDFRLGRTTVRLGYMGDYRQARVNSLKYHSYSNMLVIGIVRRFTIQKLEP